MFTKLELKILIALILQYLENTEFDYSNSYDKAVRLSLIRCGNRFNRMLASGDYAIYDKTF